MGPHRARRRRRGGRSTARSARSEREERRKIKAQERDEDEAGPRGEDNELAHFIDEARESRRAMRDSGGDRDEDGDRHLDDDNGHATGADGVSEEEEEPTLDPEDDALLMRLYQRKRGGLRGPNKQPPRSNTFIDECRTSRLPGRRAHGRLSED
ncbi:MAG: hypothetical protein U0326_34440 [Polyangiales bacterium]